MLPTDLRIHFLKQGSDSFGDTPGWSVYILTERFFLVARMQLVQ